MKKKEGACGKKKIIFFFLNMFSRSYVYFFHAGI